MRFLLLPRCAPRYISGSAANVEGGATSQIARNGKDAVEEQVAYKVLKFCPLLLAHQLGLALFIFLREVSDISTATSHPPQHVFQTPPTDRQIVPKIFLAGFPACPRQSCCSFCCRLCKQPNQLFLHLADHKE